MKTLATIALTLTLLTAAFAQDVMQVRRQTHQSVG